MTPPPAVVTAWEDAVAHWDEPARHDTLLGLVAANNCFAWAAAQYKPKAGDPIADKNLERLRMSAMATMMATASRRPDATGMPYRNVILVLLAFLILIGVGAIYAWFRIHNANSKIVP